MLETFQREVWDKWQDRDIEVGMPVEAKRWCCGAKVIYPVPYTGHPPVPAHDPVDQEGVYPVIPLVLRMNYPKPCHLCAKMIESEADLDWHGLGNCTDLPAEDCPKCQGTGMMDSGGFTPWDAPIEIRCECTYPERRRQHQ